MCPRYRDSQIPADLLKNAKSFVILRCYSKEGSISHLSQGHGHFKTSLFIRKWASKFYHLIWALLLGYFCASLKAVPDGSLAMRNLGTFWQSPFFWPRRTGCLLQVRNAPESAYTRVKPGLGWEWIKWVANQRYGRRDETPLCWLADD